MIRAHMKMRSGLAVEVLKEYGDLPTRTLARMLFTQHPEVFMTVESARSLIRYLRGALGTAKRMEQKTKTYVRQPL